MANAAPPSVADLTPVFDIPRVDGITVDGKPDDWGDRGFRVELMAGADGTLKPPSDLDARFRLAWDERGLLVLLTVRDDQFLEDDQLGTLWQRDCVGLYLADRRGGQQLVQTVIAPGMDPRFPEVRSTMKDLRKDETLKKTKPAVTVARTKVASGYVMEVLLPWANVGFTPRPGAEAGFNAFVDDFDGQRLFNAVWYPLTGTFMDTKRMYSVRLAERPSPPVIAAARPRLNGMKGSEAVVVGLAELAGKTVSLAAQGSEIARGTLVSDGHGVAARLFGPFPPPEATWTSLEVLLDGKAIESVPLPDIAEGRRLAQLALDVSFSPGCFTGAAFPVCAFDDVIEAYNILGPHALQITYYDADFKAVDKAERPGRYGAIVEIRRPNAPPLKRFHTLCRLPQDLVWRNRAAATAAQLGLDPVVGSEQAQPLLQYFATNWRRQGGERTDGAATIFAWLLETPAGQKTSARNDPWTRSIAWLHELRRRTGDLVPLNYVAYLPPGVDAGQAQKLPAILFLHGSDPSRNEDYKWLESNPVANFLKDKQDARFIVIAPHCPPRQQWTAPALDDLLAEVTAKYPIDLDRVYLTGLSLGGIGSWMYAVAHPDRFAAVVPICGMGDPDDLDLLKDLPVWVFHGAKDPSVPVERGTEMVERLRQLRGRVRLTVYPEAGHDSWTATYTNPELYDWLLQQVRGKPQQAPEKK